MLQNHVRLSVPAEASFARVVRMTASNLAVLCQMGLDDVEDVRMAAEEGFVYTCATRPASCDVTFELNPGEVRMGFALGDSDAEEDAETNIDMVEALLAAVCADFGFIDDGATLSLIMKARTNDR